MGFPPTFPEFTTPHGQGEPDSQVEAADSPDSPTQPQDEATAGTSGVVQGLSQSVTGPSLVGDPLEIPAANRRIYDEPLREPEPAIPTDQLVLENGQEPQDEEGSPEEPAQEPEQVEYSARPEYVTRIGSLSLAIERYPTSPANYVLRGEAYLAEYDYAHAERDFLTAVELAEQGAETADWGYIHRAFYDRAKEGLRHCR